MNRRWMFTRTTMEMAAFESAASSATASRPSGWGNRFFAPVVGLLAAVFGGVFAMAVVPTVALAQDAVAPAVSGTAVPTTAEGTVSAGTAEEAGAAAAAKPTLKCDFRVNSQISRNADKASIMEGKTLFHDGVVYDFLGRFQEVAVFNLEAGRVYLLDLGSKKKLVLTQDQLQANMAKLQQWGASQGHKEVKDYIAPKFEVSLNKDVEPEEYTFRSPMLVYHVIPGKPGSPEMLEAYQRFAELSCQFNLLLSPGVRTLFGRMEVNKTLYKAGRLVERLQVDVKYQRGPFSQKETYFSTLQYLPRLVESDLASIRQIDEYIAMFPEMTLGEYKTAHSTQTGK